MSTKTKSGKKETLNHILKARVTELEYYRPKVLINEYDLRN